MSNADRWAMADAVPAKVREATERAFAQGSLIDLFDRAREGLVYDPLDARMRYLMVLAAARLGDHAYASELYEQFELDQSSDEDPLTLQDKLALKARLLKDRALDATGPARQAAMQAASDAYWRVFERTGGYYSQINAATTALLAGDDATARRIAAAIIERPDVRDDPTFYAAATLAEARLLLGDLAGAEAAVALTADLAGGDRGRFTPMIKQFRLIADALTLDSAAAARLLRAVAPPAVIAFCGHLFVDGLPQEAGIASQMRAVLDALGPVVAYGALACGADIIAAEAVIAAGGELRVVLPFGEASFIARSVVVGGASWLPRYRACMAAAHSVIVATREGTPHDDRLFGYGSMLTMGLAKLHADTLATTAHQIALLDGSRNGGGSLSSRDVDLWTASGARSSVLDIGPVPRPEAASNAGAATAMSSGAELRAILFADYANFSQIPEDRMPAFITGVMARLGAILDDYGDAVQSRNSWGDAVHATMSSLTVALAIAQRMQGTISKTYLAEIGLPLSGDIRISLHYGPVFHDYDAITRTVIAFGTEVNHAARIEPKVPLGSIYVTRAFAASATLLGHASSEFAYVGQIELPKKFGKSTLYRVNLAARSA